VEVKTRTESQHREIQLGKRPLEVNLGVRARKAEKKKGPWADERRII